MDEITTLWFVIIFTHDKAGKGFNSSNVIMATEQKYAVESVMTQRYGRILNQSEVDYIICIQLDEMTGLQKNFTQLIELGVELEKKYIDKTKSLN